MYFSILFSLLAITPLLIVSLYLFNILEFLFDKDFEGEIVSKEATEEMVFHHNMNKWCGWIPARAHNDHDYSVENVVNCEIKADDGKIYTDATYGEGKVSFEYDSKGGGFRWSGDMC